MCALLGLPPKLEFNFLLKYIIQLLFQNFTDPGSDHVRHATSSSAHFADLDEALPFGVRNLSCSNTNYCYGELV